MGTGWVRGGAIPGTHRTLESGGRYSGAGPGSPGTGLEWVVSAVAPAEPCPHPPGPVGTPAGSLPGTCLSSPGKPASGPIRARLRSIYEKLSQNDEVSLKSHQKACHSPYFRNGPHNSPLGILRFPYFRAFSPKELMVPFWPVHGEMCQNDEVSPVCTRMFPREVYARYPHRSPQQAAPGDRLLIWLGAVFSSDPFITRN